MRKLLFIAMFVGQFTHMAAQAKTQTQQDVNAFMTVLSDEELDGHFMQALRPMINLNPGIDSAIKSPEDVMLIAEIDLQLQKMGVNVQVPEELEIAEEFQDFINQLTAQNEELDYLGLILKEVFERAGVSFDISFENTLTRGHYNVIYNDADGNEIFRHERIDFIGRINIENIRFGDTQKSIGDIYISDWDWAPGNKLIITPRP